MRNRNRTVVAKRCLITGLDETKAVDKALGRSIEWIEVPSHHLGRGHLCEGFLSSPEEVELAKSVIQEYRQNFIPLPGSEETLP
jgi:hypothetical protein